MAAGPEEYDELTKEIRNLLQQNQRFLQRVMEEDFEPEDGEEEAETLPEDFEEL